jgi:hypothetical protein
MIKADSRYNGTVAPGSQLYETQTGTLGYQVMLECPEGSTSFVIWLTDKNRERAKKYFEILGVDAEALKDPGYIEYQLGLDIEGREVSFGTKDEEYNGRHSVKVVWIGKKSMPDLSRSAAQFFGGKGDKQPSRSDADSPASSNYVPF